MDGKGRINAFSNDLSEKKEKSLDHFLFDLFTVFLFKEIYAINYISLCMKNNS